MAATCDLIDFTIYDPVPNQYGNCSGNGVCKISANAEDELIASCSCKPGWTGRSDFVNTEGIDCQINILAIQLLWLAVLVLMIVTQVLSAPKIIERVIGYKRFRESERQRGKAVSIWSNRGLLAALSHSFVCFPATIMYALLRIVVIEERVGVTVTATVLFIIGKLGFYVSGWLFQPALLASILHGQKFKRDKINRLIMINNVLSLFVMVISIVSGFYAIVPLVYGGQLNQESQTTFAAYNGTMVFTLAVWATTFKFIEINVAQVLGESYMQLKSLRTKEIKERLVEMQRSSFNQAILQMSLYGLFLFYPFMWNKHDYFHPISWLTFGILGKKMAYTVVTSDKSSSKASKSTEDIQSFSQSSSQNSGVQTKSKLDTPVEKLI